MIEVKNISKQFDGYPAVQQMNMTIGDSSVFGLIGTNGSGKSTFLRMAAGVLRPDEGEILIDGALVWEEPGVKQKLFFISDDAFFFQNAAPKDMEEFYCKYYPDFDRSRFEEMLRAFGLDRGRKLRAFSKGMKKQFFIAAGLAANTKYLLCDETFDGLDPVMRQAAKSLFAEAMTDRGLTVVLASHNLRELEDICDSVGLLHKGGVLLSKDLDDMKENLHKVQIVYRDESPKDADADGIEIVREETRGRLHTLIVRGTAQETQQYFNALEPVFFELIPLSLEEIFISETEVAGYDIKNLLA
ncbi:MAG: ABC transporter ATP-binding protein [Lachnospiraceae bacterium]|nr:ABC transporter ATP-binding protein [Lachnospiraceae bacterium]